MTSTSVVSAQTAKITFNGGAIFSKPALGCGLILRDTKSTSTLRVLQIHHVFSLYQWEWKSFPIPLQSPPWLSKSLHPYPSKRWQVRSDLQSKYHNTVTRRNRHRVSPFRLPQSNSLCSMAPPVRLSQPRPLLAARFRSRRYSFQDYV